MTSEELVSAQEHGGGMSAVANTALEDAQEMVREFHEKFGCQIGFTPGLRGAELRGSLILEEANETADAAKAGDLPKAIDGLCDTIYVCLGAAISWGVDLSPFFEEIHRTNMAKEGGGTRADGKILKPPGWKPPDIARILDEQLR